MAGRKLFVGSLPADITDSLLRSEFSRFGQIEDVFIKPGCAPTKQWAFVTFAAPEQAQQAKDATDRVLHFQGSERPCDVMVAKNQGMFGQEPAYAPPASTPAYAPSYAPGYGHAPQEAPKKVFVGSLPEGISETELRAEFSRYGQIADLFVNNKPVESGRQWAFITFQTSDQAQNAKVSADRMLVFSGSERPCEVTLARHQGMYGKDSQHSSAQPQKEGPKKIFVGSLPQGISDASLQAEFSRYGQVVDVHINNKPCEPGRNWAFVSFASSDQAVNAKDATDRILMFPGAEKACEVMLAKNQGKFGQEPFGGGGGSHGAPAGGQGVYVPPPGGYSPHQPPPPPTPPPPSLTPWRMYKTASGLPYYHNHKTGVTQWECPPDLQLPGQGNPYAGPQVVAPTQGRARYTPY